MPNNVTFAYNSDQISPQAASALTPVATTLNQFPETLLTMAGHTDSDGNDAYNMDSSRRRATAVSEFLMAQGVVGGRLQAIASGGKPARRQQQHGRRQSTQSPGGTIDSPQSSCRAATARTTAKSRLLSPSGRNPAATAEQLSSTGYELLSATTGRLSPTARGISSARQLPPISERLSAADLSDQNVSPEPSGNVFFTSGLL